MSTTDLWQANGNGHSASHGPSDREVVEALQRIASARAHLSHAEAQARALRTPDAEDERRSPEIEAAHAELLWAQAGLLTTTPSARAEQVVQDAAAAERAVLARHGFPSFRDYLQHRNGSSTVDTHLALARREFAAAQEAWQRLQAAMTPTMIIDLTGDEPRIL